MAATSLVELGVAMGLAATLGLVAAFLLLKPRGAHAGLRRRPRRRRRDPPNRTRGGSGFSLIELLFAMGLAATVGLVAFAEIGATLEQGRATAAARYLAARLQRLRLEAVSRNAHVALRFEVVDGHYAFGTYVDGNGDGVRTADIADGIDPQSGPSERLRDHFPTVDIGAMPGVPGVDAGGVAPGPDPVRLGASDMAVFTPLGTATSGTIYILGAGRLQLAVRVYGETGRTRALRFNSTTAQWIPLAGQ